MRTKVFKSGDSFAVHIPPELGFVNAAQDVDIERVGNTLVVRRIEAGTLEDIGNIVSKFSPGFMAEGREFHVERD